MTYKNSNLRFIRNINNWKVFPSVSTLGYYNSLGNYIYLDEYKDDEDFKKSLKNAGSDRKRLSVYFHELQHYIDQISTLWGIKKIYKIYEAYNSAINPKEDQFYKYRELTLNLKRDYFLEYYTEKYHHSVGDFKNRWKYKISSGIRYDHNGQLNNDWPIPFIVFYTNNDEKISRVPISVVSLLETTATYAEYNFNITQINKLESPYREIQLKSLSTDLESKLYHPDLTLYSAAVHITATNLQITDPIIAYKISSIFGKIALNIPSVLFDKMTIPNEFISAGGDWHRRAKKFLERNDRGFAFYILIKNYSLKYGVLNDNDIPINDILSASNLPKEEEVEELIKEEVTELDYHVMSSGNRLDRLITDKVFFGNKFRENTGIGQQRQPEDLSEFQREAPFLMFNSTDFEYENLPLEPIIIKAVSQEDLSTEEWFRFYIFCEKKIDDFNEICGV